MQVKGRITFLLGFICYFSVKYVRLFSTSFCGISWIPFSDEQNWFILSSLVQATDVGWVEQGSVESHPKTTANEKRSQLGFFFIDDLFMRNHFPSLLLQQVELSVMAPYFFKLDAGVCLCCVNTAKQRVIHYRRSWPVKGTRACIKHHR